VSKARFRKQTRSKKAKQTLRVCLKGFGFIQLPRKTMQSIGSPEALGKDHHRGSRRNEVKPTVPMKSISYFSK
jgi:hypothetical protein